ncbi:MAG: aldo/keto reductase [Planctomycetaceae bacterium]
MQHRPLGNSVLVLPAIGYGAFKIGRNQGIKYAQPYDLPSDGDCERLLNSVLDAGITYIDTAPAYGISEERIGKFISHRRGEFVLSTKVGEEFSDGVSRYDYSANAVHSSITRSLHRLKTDVLDIVFIHSHGEDVKIQQETDVVETLRKLKAAGTIRAIGLSGKTVEGARLALDWADAIMVEYHLQNPSHSDVMHAARERGIGVVVKKGLSSGQLSAGEAIRFVLDHPAVSSVVIGGLNFSHLQENIRNAEGGRGEREQTGSGA